MSLLNDALRKKRAERLPGEPRATKAVSTGTRAGRKKGYRLAVMGVAALVAMLVAVVWWAWAPGDAVSTTVGHLPATGQADALPAGAPAAAVPPAPAAETGRLSGKSDAGPPMAAAALKTAASEPEALPSPTPSVPAANEKHAPEAKAALTQPPRRTEVHPETVSAARPASARQAVPPLNAPAAAPAAPPKAQLREASAERLYRKGRAYHRQGRIEEAIAMYREVLKIDPDHFDTCFNLTSAYLQTEAFDKAYAMAADLYRKTPANPRVALNLAIAQIGCGRPRQALELLDAVADQPQPPLYEIYFHKGVAYRYLGQPDQAVTWYQKAERIRPNDPRLMFNLAMAFDQERRYGPAVDYYRRYLRESKDQDPLTRKKVAQRIRTLQADLAAHPNEEEQTR